MPGKKILYVLGSRFATTALVISALAFAFLIYDSTPAASARVNAGDSTAIPIAEPDTTPRVTGIGGIFFRTDSPKETREWYGKHLGLAIDQYGSPFETRNANRPEEINYLMWSPFKKTTDYFAPSEKEFMINYRVQNIEGLVANLRAAGVTIVDTIETVEYGKFVHIMDPYGNKLELWEPIDSELTKLGGKTTK